MNNLALSLQSRENVGEPLPTVFHQLERAGVFFRTGVLSLVAGADGCGKTTFSSWLVRHLPLGGIYFCADSDILAFAKNVVAELRECTLFEAEDIIKSDPSILDEVHEATKNMWVCFQANPSPKDIREEVDAYAYSTGEWPKYIVIDNLMDVSVRGEDERRSQMAVLEFLKAVAAETGAAVIVLLHVTGDYVDGSERMPLSALINKVSKPARLVLTLYKDDVTTLGVCVVKQTSGPADADGNYVIRIPWIKEMAYLGTE